MICNPRELHDNEPHIIDALGGFDAQELFNSKLPADIVDGRRAVVKPVGERCDLVKRPAFRNFFKCTVNVPYGLLGIKNDFPVHFQDVLEDPMRGRVRRAEIQGRILLFGVHKPSVNSEK